MKVGRLDILGFNLCFVFRHKWDEKAKESFYDYDFKDYKLGVWYKISKVVGKKHFKDPNKWGDNLIVSHMLGLNLLVIKMWMTIDRGSMILK